MNDFPREISLLERSWLEWLLPSDRPGYATLRDQVRDMIVLGEGRWGTGDLVLGHSGMDIDLTEGMQPVFATGEISITTSDLISDTLLLSLHQPNDIGSVEFQITVVHSDQLPDPIVENSRWCYSYWNPGERCPATQLPVREVSLNESHDLLLVFSVAKRSLWIHDAIVGTNTLLPVAGFYNELVLLKGSRDPNVVFDHKRLFVENESFQDADLQTAFGRYNTSYRKVDRGRLSGAVGTSERKSLREKLGSFFGTNGAKHG